MKESISKVKRQTSEWEKLIVNEITDKEFIPKIFKQPMQLNTKNNSIKKCAYLNRYFSKEAIQMANKHVKMLNITNYQRNANKNYDDVSSYTGQNGHYQKVYAMLC